MGICRSTFLHLFIEPIIQHGDAIIKKAVWEYLEEMYDDATWPDSDPAACVDACWSDHWQALQDLVQAFAEVNSAAQEGTLFGSALDDEAMEHPSVMAMLAAPEVMISIIQRGISAVARPHAAQLVAWLEQTKDQESASAIVLAIASTKLEQCESVEGQALVDVLTDIKGNYNAQAKAFAVQGLGKAKQVSEATVQAVVGIAADQGQPQPLRSVAIESLMDMGPAAKSAAPALKKIKESDVDEDLRQFAWAALKSITALQREHPKGGTVAEHMRSLYTTDPDE